MSEMEWKAASWVAALSAVPQATSQPCPELRVESSKQVFSNDSAMSAWAALWHSLLNWEHMVTSSCRAEPEFSPAPLQPVQKFKPQRYIIICDFTDTHLSCYRSWCPASPPCTLPAPNAPAKLLWRLLYLLDSLATSKGVYNFSLQRS